MPKMDFSSLGSGSSGNGTVIRAANTTLLIDCGFSRIEVERRLLARGLSIDKLDAVLVTHEHGDHLKGIATLARRDGVPIFASQGTIDVLRRRDHRFEAIEQLVNEVEAGSAFRVKDIAVHPIDVPHDVNEPMQFVCRFAGVAVGVLTDCGSFTDRMVQHYSGINGLLLESNHDTDMLQSGPYPPQLKRRVGGDLGHLSNRQSREFAQRIHHPNLQQLVLGHISLQNNDHSLIAQEFNEIPNSTAISYATQEWGTDWLSVTAGGEYA